MADENTQGGLQDRPIELGMLTVAEAVALRDELLRMRGAHRRSWGTLKDIPMTGRLIRSLDDELGAQGKAAPVPTPTVAPAAAAEGGTA